MGLLSVSIYYLLLFFFSFSFRFIVYFLMIRLLVLLDYYRIMVYCFILTLLLKKMDVHQGDDALYALLLAG